MNDDDGDEAVNDSQVDLSLHNESLKFVFQIYMNFVISGSIKQFNEERRCRF